MTPRAASGRGRATNGRERRRHERDRRAAHAAVGGDGHAVYAVQILSRDAIVPATTTTLSIKPSFYERNTGDLQLCQPPPAFLWSLVTPTP